MLAAFEVVLAVLVELGGCNVQRQCHVGAQLVACSLDCLHDQVQCSLGGVHGRCEAALVAQAGRQSLVFDDLLQGVVDLGAHAQCFVEGLCADWGNHEFLHVHAGICVCATVEDVHHWHRKDVTVRAANVAEQWQACGFSGGVSHGHGDTQDGVGAQAGLVIGAVQSDHRVVDQALVVSFEAHELVVDLVEDVGDSLLHALA